MQRVIKSKRRTRLYYKKNLWQTIGEDFKINYQLYILILIPVIYIIVFHYVPMYGVQIAFKKFVASKGIWGSKWVGMKYFMKFFKSHQFNRVVFNTLGISIYSLLAGFPFPIILALALNTTKNRYLKKSVQMITYMPHFISTVVIAGMVIQFLSPKLGIVNKLIGMFGGQPLNFMGIPEYFSSIYVWSGIWQATGWGTIIYLAALAGISPALHEAAVVDGASRLQRIRHIDIPGIMPTITILLILSVGNIMSVGFEKALLLQNSLNLRTSEIIATYSYKVGLTSSLPNYSYGAAIGLFNSIINLVLLVSVNKISKRLSDTSLW